MPNPSPSSSATNLSQYPQQPAQSRDATRRPVVPSRYFASVNFPPPESSEILAPILLPSVTLIQIILRPRTGKGPTDFGYRQVPQCPFLRGSNRGHPAIPLLTSVMAR